MSVATPPVPTPIRPSPAPVVNAGTPSPSQGVAPSGPSFWQRFNPFKPRRAKSSTSLVSTSPTETEAQKKERLRAGLPEGLDDFAKDQIVETILEVEKLTDTQNGVEQKVQNNYITTFVLLAPIIGGLVFGYETGYFFANYRDFSFLSSTVWVQYIVSFLLEGFLVACVFEMGKAKRNNEEKRWRWLFLFWLFATGTSYVGQFMYMFVVSGSHLSIMGLVGIILRCACCCVIDLGCAGYLGKKAKTLEKQVDDLSFRSRAIRTLTESVIELQESILASVARRKEEDQRMERRRVEDESVARLRTMIMEAGLNSLTGVSADNRRGDW